MFTMLFILDKPDVVSVLHGDGPGGHHLRVVRHQYAPGGQVHPRIPSL